MSKEKKEKEKKEEKGAEEKNVTDGKMYCGDKEDLPEGYDFYGTRYSCLKRGYGRGMYDERRRNSEISDEIAKYRNFLISHFIEAKEESNVNDSELLDELAKIWRKGKEKSGREIKKEKEEKPNLTLEKLKRLR